jgi:hypothetical protein
MLCRLRCSFSISAAAALLAGCGGSQPPIGAAGAMPQTSANTAHADRGKSWMLPEAKSSDLIYATGGCGGTCVLAYPDGKLVGALNTGGYFFSADCSDNVGDVFITDLDSVIEYAHGGTVPIATLNLPGSDARTCSVDPSTGNLAVVFQGSGSNIAIFPDAQGNPELYNSEIDSSFCGYDRSGNLFVDGYEGQSLGFSELALGSGEFEKLSISGHAALPPAQVQWDGHYITYESVDKNDTTVSELLISGSTATVVGVAHFNTYRNAALSWIFGNRIFIPFGGHQFMGRAIGVWRYPKGGKHIQEMKDFTQNKTLQLTAATLSVPE